MGRDKTILLLGLITYGTGLSLLYVVFAPLARDVGLSEPQFGILISISNVALVLSSPRWGRLSERIGRKPVFIAGMVGYSVGYLALALGIEAGLREWVGPAALFWYLFCARIVYGAMVGGINPAATAYIADTTEEADRAKGMALVSVAAGLGTVVGPVFGAVLAGFGPVVPMYAAGIIALAMALLAAVALREPANHVRTDTPVRVSWRDGRVFPYLAAWFVMFGMFTAVQVITAFIIEDRFAVSGEAAQIRAVSIALLSMAFLTVIVQAVVLQKFRITPKTMLRISFILFAAVMLLLAYGQQLWTFWLGYAGLGIVFGLVSPGLNAAASLSVGRDEQGAIAGLLAAAPVAGMIFGPALGASAYGLRPESVMEFGAVLAAILAAWFWFGVQVPDAETPAS